MEIGYGLDVTCEEERLEKDFSWFTLKCELMDRL